MCSALSAFVPLEVGLCSCQLHAQEDLYYFLTVRESNMGSNLQSFQHQPEKKPFTWFPCSFLIPEMEVLRKTPVPAHNGTNKAVSIDCGAS